MGKNNNENDVKTDTTMWMVTFGDLLMLLLTFFVMLLTMSSMDTKALRSLFSVFESGLGVMEFSDLAAIKPIKEQGEIVSSKCGDLSMLSALNNRLDELLGKRQETEVGSLETLEGLLGIGRGRETGEGLGGLSSVMDVSEDERGVVITIMANVLFDSGAAEIKPGIFPLLDTIAKLLGGVSNEVLIMGHADNIPMRSGGYRSNWELSFYRALNVHGYFVQDRGLSPKRLAVGGYGDLRPRFSNSTRQGREKNRRVEIILKRI
jgi:chemotaxis protein MotB